MTLEEHFGDAGSAAEVAIYLEWGMRIEQVIQGGFLQEELNIFVSFICVVETGPKIDDPGPAPPSVAAAVGEAIINRFARGCHVLGSAASSELVSGMETEQV